MVSQDSPVWQRVWIGSLASPVSLCSIVSSAHVSTTSYTTRDSSAILVLHGKLGKASAVHWYKPLSLPRFIRLCKTRQTAVWPRLPALAMSVLLFYLDGSTASTCNVSFTDNPSVRLPSVHPFIYIRLALHLILVHTGPLAPFLPECWTCVRMEAGNEQRLSVNNFHGSL